MKPDTHYRKAPRLARADDSAFSRWYWQLDRWLCLAVFLLIAAGLLAVAAASPAAAQRLSDSHTQIPAYQYLMRQSIFCLVGVALMLFVSTLSLLAVRRGAVTGVIFSFMLLILVQYMGNSHNGAQRWLGAGLFEVQPSEFLKPFYIVSIAWLLSLKSRDNSLPMEWLAVIITVAIVYLLMKQPDFGQTVMVCLTLMVLLVLAEVSLALLGVLGCISVIGLLLAYWLYPRAHTRLDAFLFNAGDSYQYDMAHATLTASGFLGAGLGNGVEKFHLPEAQTDYIFSVIGEEYGLAACMGIAALFFFIAARVIYKALDEEDRFKALAASGLALQIGLQAAIHMGVNIGILPTKGMTLPFISYGGSSMLAVCLSYGMLLALTRRNRYSEFSSYSERE
jgi:cell division protein FtsW